MTSLKSDLPFEVHHESEEESCVVFQRLVDHPRTAAHDEQLRKLMQSSATLICDFTQSEEVTSEWLRFLADLTAEADEQGKLVAIAALRKDIREETVDALALKETLHFYDTVQEAKQA